MFDIFLDKDARKLVKGKTIVFLGDSNVRALYKDFLCLLKESRFISQAKLRNKMESTVYGDQLVYHGSKTNGRNYREEREAIVNDTHVSFFFLTKVYDDYVKDVLKRITRHSKPDVIIINSCVWDITRWGCNGVHKYKNNLAFLMNEFRRLLPNCLVIWVTTPPLAGDMKGGFLVNELQFLKYLMRFHVVEANHFARKVVVDSGFDVLDTHFHMQMQIHRRSQDGIHWEPKAVRYITNLILRHISLSWNVPLPHRYESAIVDENLVASENTKDLKIRKEEVKEHDVLVKQVHSKEPQVLNPSEKLQSTVTIVKKENAPKKSRVSFQAYKASKRKEGIHNHMAKAEKKARSNRIRKWKQPIEGNTHQSCSTNSGRNSRVKLIYGKQAQKAFLEAGLSYNSFQHDLPSSKRNSHEASHHNRAFVISPSPPSSDDPQSQNIHRQGNHHQLLSCNSSNLFDYPLISSPSQIPLPPYSPGHPQLHNSSLRSSECQLLPFDRSVNFNFLTSSNQMPCTSYNSHYNQFYNPPPQRRVIDCQTTCRSVCF